MNVNGIDGLFPLTNINARLEGYYMDAKGEVYSTRQYVQPTKLNGTKTTSGRYYTFVQKQAGRGFNNYPLTQNAAELIMKAKAHPDFAKETEVGVKTLATMPAFTPRSAAKTEKLDSKRDHASSTQVGIALKGYVIGRVEGDAMVFGSKPVIHTTLQSVKAEVQRLAEKSPGKTIFYVKIEGAAIANSIAWV